jgi:hypothetical protein
MCTMNPFGAHDPVGAVVISQLRHGDEILLAPGYGFPSSNASRTLIIADQDTFSAITTDNVRLRCDDAEGIILTGRRIGVRQVCQEVSELLLRLHPIELP